MLLRAVALMALLAGVSVGQQIRLEDGVFKVVGWPEARRLTAETAPAHFAVYVGTRPDAPALLGSCGVEDGVLIFEPRFPLEPGLHYRAVLRSSPELVEQFDIPKRDTVPSTVVEHIYPSSSVLPENQLKFYIHFSAPMSRGEAYRRVHLADETGKQIQLPFLELEEELWDRDGKRLTILFDPGRIKRGLLPHEEAGVPIEDGKSYALVVSREWLDAAGKPLKEGFRKTFRVGPADRTPPDPKTWRLTPPPAATREPLALEFPEPMDHALLERLLEVTDPRGRSLAGSIVVDREETRWRFTPANPWKAGEYTLRIGTTLEDLAGNTIGRPFEVDVFERVEERIASHTIPLPFTVK